jgi:hypothetical protein
MGKSTPSAPPPPDPTVAINAQSQANLAAANDSAALQHTNQVTPWGNLTWTKTTGPSTFDQAGYDAALSRYNSSNSNSGGGFMGGLRSAAAGSLNPASSFLNGMQGSGGGGGAPDKSAFTTTGPDVWSSNISLAPAQQALLDANNKDSLSLANIGNNQLGSVSNALSSPLDFSGAPSLYGSVSSAGQGIQSNVNQSNLNNLQTTAGYGSIQNKLDTSGIPALVGGDQLSGLMSQAQQASFNQQKAYLDPQYDQQQHDLENKLTQQGVMQNSDAWNRATNNFGLQRTQAYQNASDNSVAQGLAAENQLYGQGLSSNQNAYNQALGAGNFANSAQAQGFNQSLANAQLGNSANAQQFGQNLSSMGANNAAQSQLYGQAIGNANLSNTARTQDINEIMLQRDNPLNELNSLRNGSQVTSPQFSGGSSGNISPVDAATQYNNQFNNQMGAYNANTAQSNANTQAGISALSAAAMMFA